MFQAKKPALSAAPPQAEKVASRRETIAASTQKFIKPQPRTAALAMICFVALAAMTMWVVNLLIMDRLNRGLWAAGLLAVLLVIGKVLKPQIVKWSPIVRWKAIKADYGPRAGIMLMGMAVALLLFPAPALLGPWLKVDAWSGYASGGVAFVVSVIVWAYLTAFVVKSIKGEKGGAWGVIVAIVGLAASGGFGWVMYGAGASNPRAFTTIACTIVSLLIIAASVRIHEKHKREQSNPVHTVSVMDIHDMGDHTTDAPLAYQATQLADTDDTKSDVASNEPPSDTFGDVFGDEDTTSDEDDEDDEDAEYDAPTNFRQVDSDQSFEQQVPDQLEDESPNIWGASPISAPVDDRVLTGAIIVHGGNTVDPDIHAGNNGATVPPGNRWMDRRSDN